MIAYGDGTRNGAGIQMECRRCGLDLSGKENKNVAQWTFCLDCFQVLMEQAEEKNEPTANGQAPDTAGKLSRCLVCENEIQAGGGREMLGLIFCRQCYEHLVRSSEKHRPDFGAATPDNHSETPAVVQVRVDFKSYVSCFGCGRRILAVAGKQFDNHSYCPDCYYCLAKIEAVDTRPLSSPPASISGNTAVMTLAGKEKEGNPSCQACQRPGLPVNLKIVEGFAICRACLDADRETALEIARVRYRKALERINKNFNDN
jgi:hypothetical protein